MAEKVKKATAPRTTGATAPKKVATRKTASKASVTQMKASHEEIARLAHRYWAERGRQHGQDAEDWFRAEHELLGKAS
ncbi:MAG: DUF2934 domain-containing protein [Terracidiphilus sp.]